VEQVRFKSGMEERGFMEEGLKFIWPWTLTTPLLRYLSLVRWDFPGSIGTPDLKFLASPVPNLWKGV